MEKLQDKRKTQGQIYGTKFRAIYGERSYERYRNGAGREVGGIAESGMSAKPRGESTPRFQHG